MPEIARLVGGRLLAGSSQQVDYRYAPGCLTTDSRTLQPGQLFVALRGERFDGHHFVREAFAQGGAAALVARSWYETEGRNNAPTGPLIVVEDPLEGLQTFAHLYRCGFSLPLVGVTGSNGKTTTKDLIHAALASQGRTLKTEGNLNNHIGVPLTLLRLDASYQAAVVEMGMNAPGEIDRLARLARPTVGVITNIGPAHLAFLETLEGVAKAKAELLCHLDPETGMAILNGDDEWTWRLLRDRCAHCITVAVEGQGDIRACNLVCDHNGAFCFTVEGGPTIQLAVPGRHNVTNALLAYAVAHHLGVSDEGIREGLAAFCPATNRMELISRGGVKILNDSYNANPLSMKVALDTLGLIKGERRVAVLGDMLELGALGPQAHAEVGRAAAGSHLHLLIAVGRYGEDIARGAREAGLAGSHLLVMATAPEAGRVLIDWVRPGDIVLVKGSRAMAMERIVEALLATLEDTIVN